MFHKSNKLSPLSHNYLKLLGDIAQCPELLYIVGSIPEQRRISVAIVGTRKPTPYGREVTHQLAYDLAKKGIVIISGLALGVDGIAHRAALEAGGTTIAVLGNGFPGIYPTAHHSLAEQIVNQRGAVLTEYSPDTPAIGFRFLERNRLVSGLADAVLITEAAARSGTLNTAGHALEQGREVFVVPGNITSPLSAGCNMLIRQGATPVTSANDILEALNPELLESQSALPLGTTSEETIILSLIQSGVRDGELLQQQSKLAPHIFASTLTMLEINGVVRSLGANQWALR